MEFIGRVVTNSRSVGTMDFVDRTSKTYLIDTSIPTLIVGKELAENTFGKDKVRILDKKIRNNLFWTYSKSEKCSEFEKDMEKFNLYVVDKLRERLKYCFFSILTSPLNRIKSLINYIDDKSRTKVVYIHGNHLYIYAGDGIVIGLSMDETAYIGINRDKIVSKIRSNPNNKTIEDTKFLSYGLKSYIGDDLTVIPYLYSLDKDYFS